MGDRKPMMVAICPACGREIEILQRRWTAHTDPKTWGLRDQIKQCVNAGKVAQPQGGGE